MLKFNPIAIVPEDVIGLPEIEIPPLPEAATLVIVPVLVKPVQVLGVVIVKLVPSTVAIVALLPAAANDADLFST